MISNRAVFVSNEPIKPLKLFELNIDKIKVQEISSMELGVCMYNEFPEGTFYAGKKYGQGRGFWFLSENKLCKDFASIGGGYKLNLCNIRVNDRVGFVKYPDGTMGFLYNGQYQGIAFRNIPEGVYGLVAITGKCVKVSISDNSGISIQEETSVHTFNEPMESFSVRTADAKSVRFSRLRQPYGLDFINEETHKEMKDVYKETEISDETKKKEHIESENKFNPIVNAGLQARNDGYSTESNLRTVIKLALNLYNIHSNSITRIDSISKVPIQGIANLVKIFGDTLNILQRNNPPPEATNILPNRLKQIFDVVRPCFDNIQDMSGIVWTGSTSEGFAIPDNSDPDTPYIDQEMDLMIPLAMATEGSQKGPSDMVAMQSCKANEKDIFKREYVVTELENIGKRQLSKDFPSFIWIPSSNAGYVFIIVPESMQSCISEDFTKHVCARSHETSNLFLTRSKLLAIQEEYTRGRLSAVQSDITSERNNIDGQFQGQLKLVQEGPVQTISVNYQLQEIGGSLLEFDQTVDVAIALKGVDWPTIANPWISRERNWPEKTIVNKIIEGGYHIVPKYHPGGNGIDLEWRLSFSVAERTLAHTFTDNQRKCYMVFKKLWRTYLKVPKVVSSYHIKTTMFWLCERASSSLWKDSDLGYRYLDLQNFLIFFLQRRNVPNFFIPENNMLSNVDPTDIDVVLAKAQDIRRHQFEHHKSLVTPSSAFHFA
ncbi:uncharacterized protein LOC117118295 [Anneissia japonica]|uniref:uncharacterized protein LOC117118295 n=1 Tax=Anneissia japonica TaxID=1529436 RepID=UPI001425B769|nr:uncharacterized protein LOC117118295 [Anneissia japonica]